MKNNTIIVAALLIIAIGGYYAYSLAIEDKESETVMSPEGLSNFNIGDTASIDKIKITIKDVGDVTLVEKTPHNWYLEGTDTKAFSYNINLILKTAKQIRSKQDVSKKTQQSVITQLSLRHRKVEFFEAGQKQPVKVWYIGSATQDHEGTYMLLENWNTSKEAFERSQVPYIVHLPGMRGTLDSRFFIDPYLWKDAKVFSYKSLDENGREEMDISNISLTIKDQPQQSYTVQKTLGGIVSLKDGNGATVSTFDTLGVQHYITHFDGIAYEKVIRNYSPTQIDSVTSLIPDYVLKVTDGAGATKEVKVWKKKLANPEINEMGIKLEYDISTAVAQIPGSAELVSIQYHTWDKLFKPLSYYLPMNTVDYTQP